MTFSDSARDSGSSREQAAAGGLASSVGSIYSESNQHMFRSVFSLNHDTGEHELPIMSIYDASELGGKSI